MELDYRQVFETMPCYLTVQDRDLQIVDANQRFAADFGPPQGRACYQAYKQRSEPCEVCPVERSFRDGKPHQSEEVVLGADGRERSMVVFTAPLRNGGGQVDHVLELSADITELKLLEQKLRESRQRYQTLFEEVPCFISIQDRDLKVVEANRRFREAFGACLGQPCHQVYKHRDEPCVNCPVKATFDDGGVRRSEEVVTSQQGEQINTLVYSAPILDAAGQIRSVMEMSADITPIRQLQSQLESIGLLISSVSHGIKGLLTGLDGGIYMVNTALQKDRPERLAQGWEMVRRNVDRIRSLVLNILYYAKEREPSYEEIAATGLLDEVAALIAPKAKELGVELQVSSGATAGSFDADHGALRALLVNLLENSLDACRVDGKDGVHRVTLAASGDEHRVELRVEDNGIGMDRETREKVFSLFFSSKGLEGTGLGLFIAQKIAKAHGGNIELDSEPERGTCFKVRIPRRRVEDTR